MCANWELKENLQQLTDPTLPDDEHLGWALTAIAAKILGAKGGYRCPSQRGGFLYILYLDLRFANASAQPVEDRSNDEVECDEHGPGQRTYVCEHLVSDPQQKWFSTFPTDENPWPDAWCSICQKAFQREGEWNDRSEGRLKIKLLCHRCYESRRALGTPMEA